MAVTGETKSAKVRRLNAELTLGRGENFVQALGRNSLDVVLDLVAAEQWPGFLEVLRPGGRYAVSGAIGGAMIDLDVQSLYQKDLSLLGCTALELEAFLNLIGVIESGDIVPVVAATYPLERIADAQRAFQTKSYVGEVGALGHMILNLEAHGPVNIPSETFMESCPGNTGESRCFNNPEGR